MSAIGQGELQIVSVDDHVLEPPDIWVERLPARNRETGPRVERVRGRTTAMDGAAGPKGVFVLDPEGFPWDIWRYEDMVAHIGAIELPKDDDHPERVYTGTMPGASTFEGIRPGAYQQGPRLADMDRNGVEASLCYPNTIVRFAGQTFVSAKDKELALLCVRAYNDWMIDEWCAGSGGRLIPLCVVPLWDAQLAADEVRRTAGRGSHAVCFSELPTYLGLPSIHSDWWDTFLAACQDTDTVINIHIGSASKLFGTSQDAPVIAMNALTFVNSAMSMTDWILSGKLQQYPRLRLTFAESQIGWVPYLLDRLDRAWEHYPDWGWGGTKTAREALPEPPSSYFHSHILSAFFEDAHGTRHLHDVGIDNVAFETDYPHNDGTFPHSAKILTDALSGHDDITIRKVVRGNAIRHYNLSL
jgi:predicted TIM-barrel fold metal-dependent hydrolase